MTPAAHCSAAPLGKERRKGRKLNSPEWRKKALRMDFRMRIGLGKHVAERKDEVVQVPMIVELTLIVIKRGIRANSSTSNFCSEPGTPSGLQVCLHLLAPDIMLAVVQAPAPCSCSKASVASYL